MRVLLSLVCMLVASDAFAACGGGSSCSGRVVTPIRNLAEAFHNRPRLRLVKLDRGCSSAPKASCGAPAAAPCAACTVSEPSGNSGKFVSDTGAAQYAAQLNHTAFVHDRSYNGPEVIFRSSGVATQDQAMVAWQNSPGHRKLLPRITDIQCVGGNCVGRGR